MTQFSNSNSPSQVVQTPFDAAKRSVLRACATRFCWCEIETDGLLNAFMQLSLRYLTLFPNKSNLSQCASYTDRCHSIREAIQHCALQICCLLFSPWFAYMGKYRLVIYHAQVNYTEIFFNLRYLLATKTSGTICSYYYSWHW